MESYQHNTIEFVVAGEQLDHREVLKDLWQLQ